MADITKLFENNRAWVAHMTDHRPDFFEKLANQQSPEYLWIGCADSRVPANDIVGLMPGDLFVHRNVANIVVQTDLNCLAVLQYAVEVLKVKHVIVCGHYGCGGVRAALGEERLGLIDNWLRHVQHIARRHKAEIDSLHTLDQKCDRLCQLNAIEQAMNVCDTTVVQDAWARGQELMVHGWIYRLHDGLIRDMGFTVAGNDEIPVAYRTAIHRQAFLTS